MRTGVARADATVAADDFGRDDADTWGAAWSSEGIANLLLTGGRGELQAGTRVAPASKRAIAFLVDRRVRDATVSAVLSGIGIGAGVVARRVGPGWSYAAMLDRGGSQLKLVSREAGVERVLAQVPVAPLVTPLTLSLATNGALPTTLHAVVVDANGDTGVADAVDSTDGLQAAGDPGVVATSEMINRGLRLAEKEVPGDPLAPPTEAVIATLSTTWVDRVTVTSTDVPAPTTAGLVAAATGIPRRNGATALVVADVPCDVDIEIDGEVVAHATTGPFHSAVIPFHAGKPGRRVAWRPVLVRGGTRTPGPTMSFRCPPSPRDGGPVRVVVGSCADTLEGIFASIAAEEPDVFVWEGDLLYPDYVGPLMQTASGYAGWWTALLSAPELRPIFDRACFAPQRDDHDYGNNNLDPGAIPDWAITPYEGVLCTEPYYSFRAGALEVWVLDERRWRSPVGDPDTEAKTILGAAQRAWLQDALVESDAPWKLVCSPCPLFEPTNRDSCWGDGFTAERDAILAFVDANVGGRVVWVTGDSHSPAVIERPGFLEIRSSPMATTNHPPSRGDDVAYSGTGTCYLVVDATAESLELRLNDDTGAPRWSTTLT